MQINEFTKSENAQAFLDHSDPMHTIGRFSENCEWSKCKEFFQLIGIQKYREKIEDIAKSAKNEADIKKKFEGIEHLLRQLNVQTTNYQEGKEMYILGNNEEMINKVEESIIILADLQVNK